MNFLSSLLDGKQAKGNYQPAGSYATIASLGVQFIKTEGTATVAKSTYTNVTIAGSQIFMVVGDGSHAAKPRSSIAVYGWREGRFAYWGSGNGMGWMADNSGISILSSTQIRITNSDGSYNSTWAYVCLSIK